MPLPTCECVAGLPTQQQLANIYCALYTLAQGGGGGGVTYPLSPTLGGTGVANAAAETITINGGAGIVLDQSLQTTDTPVFSQLTITQDITWGGSQGSLNADGSVSAVTFNALTITANAGATLNIAAAKTLIVSTDYTLQGADPTTIDSDNATPPAINSFSTPADVFGSNTIMLGGPAQWFTLVINGVTFRCPLYTT